MTRIAAEEYLDALAAQGIEYLFCNPGTDFAPIVEAYSRAARTNRKVPKPLVIPHENCAVAMSHGFLRPFVSRAWRREIEADADDEDDDQDEDEASGLPS